ncbi:MAG: cupin domain-containing protein [Firmicutes bacterium]|nr:cupin domain-containing protein [Bacillota bacterium]
MSENIKEISRRLKELREIEGISAQSFAKQLGISVDLYLNYESGETDIPVSFLYDAANRLKVDLTTLLTGQQPKLHIYSLVKKGEGLDVRRSKQYKYKNLAYNFFGKKAEPFLVTVEPTDENAPISLNSHPGQEMNYVLSGTVEIKIGETVLTLSEGDTVYYNSAYPHGMRAIGEKSATFLALIF